MKAMVRQVAHAFYLSKLDPKYKRQVLQYTLASGG